MECENSFSYTYSAKVNQEVQAIRSKYLPQEESKLDELKRLDRMVQKAGTAESLLVGIAGSLIFGFGMCLSMGVIGNAPWLGVIIGLLGGAVMLFAYPVNRRCFDKARQQYAPRILCLIDELSCGS